MNNLLTRTLTGFIYVAILLLFIYTNKYTFLVLFITIQIIALMEFYTLSIKKKAKPQSFYAILISTLFFICNFLFAVNHIDIRLLLLFIPLYLFCFIIEMYRNSKRPFLNIAFTYLGIVYITIPLSLTNYIVLSSNSSAEITNFFEYPFNYLNNPAVIYTPQLLIGILFIVWSFDTFAYIGGLLFGFNYLFPRISPKKTWEGTIIGAIITFFITYIISIYFKQLSLLQWEILSLIVIIFGSLGDLVESLFKRELEVKDSGYILAGHGGLLDRIDSLLLALPYVYIYLEFFIF